MKKFTFLAFTAILLLSFGNLFAQQKPVPITSPTQVDRCGTMKAIEHRIATDPAYRAWYEQSRQQAAQAVQEYRNNPSAEVYRTNLTTIVTIPLVVHIVLPNPEIVTDDDVEYVVNRLNLDYSGLNPDSTNGSLFYGVRGHSLIRFCLAKRDPSGNLTNGIERRVGNVLIGFGEPQAIKNFASGGLNPWNTSQYYNIWVGGAAGGLLGIAPAIGVGTAASDGVCINYQGFSNNSCYTIPAFNQGRTAVHEIGHNFGLYHTFQGGCNATNDFGQLTSPGCSLPASLLDPSDDTPAQNNSTSGCPNGVANSGCAQSPNPPGRMYQNYMDYTDDACYSMFSAGNVERMHWLLENCRAGYLTSLGCTPPATAPALDASPTAVVNPGGSEVTGCTSTTYGVPNCAGPVTNPKVRITNLGLTNITSLSVICTFNGSPFGGTQNVSGLNVKTGSSVVVTFPGTANFINGLNTLVFTIVSVNGGPDDVPANNILTQNYNLGGGGNPLPLTEGFESTTFPPAGWTRNNPDNGITWQRTTTGVEHGGVGKASVDHFNYTSTGQIDELQTPVLAVGTVDSLFVSFWGAYKGYPGFPFENTQVLVSTNCGSTYTTVYDVRDDTAFAVAPTTTTAQYFPASIADWRQKSIDLTAYSGSSIIVKFRQVNRFGNNFHLDDININKFIFKNNDAGVAAINKPGTRECVNSGDPEVVIKNFGKLALTSVIVNYQIDGGAVSSTNWTGNLPRNGTAVVTLPTASFGATGPHTIKAFTSMPNNVVDEEFSNDTLSKDFTTFPVIPLTGSVVEGFNTSTFPPAGWLIYNPNADMTWEWISNIGRNAPGAAWFNNYNNATNNRFDDLLMPNFSYNNIDSIFLKFNLSTVTYSYPGATGILIDTLTVLLSKDCGNTFTTIYKKWGEDLQTVNDPNFPRGDEFFPAYNYHWRLDSLNLGKWLGSSETQFLIGFRYNGNFENNIFLDDINLRTQVLPAKLKSQGYLVLPNPFNTTFAIWHYQDPSNLRYVNVYNSSGQLVWSRKYNGEAQRYIVVDLSKNAAGIYNVTLGYDDSNRNVVVPVIKY